MFDSLWESYDFQQIKSKIESSTRQDAERALNNPTVENLTALLAPAAAPFLEEMAQRARAITLERFGNTIQIYAPLYLSNVCGNGCLYCGFSAQNKGISRRTLTHEEAEAELQAIHDMGIRHILLLTGEAPAKVGLDYIRVMVELAGKYSSYQGIEIYPLDTEGYKTLTDAGVDNLTVYQETYEPVRYDELHPAGKKKDMRWRLNAPDRGGLAGMRALGVGALLGLSEPRADFYFTVLHAAYLMKTYWRSHVTLSLPRIRKAEGAFTPEYTVDDRLFVQMFTAARLVLPDAGIVVSTRERAEFRDNLVGLGVTQMSAASATEPGGYTCKNLSTPQFQVEDARSVEEFTRMLLSKGYDPIMKDWDAALKSAL